MTYTVEIIDNETGEKRISTPFPGEVEAHDYLWTDGNYGCDCNRALFFAEAANGGDCDIECGETRYTVPKAILEDGTEVEIDQA